LWLNFILALCDLPDFRLQFLIEQEHKTIVMVPYWFPMTPQT